MVTGNLRGAEPVRAALILAGSRPGAPDPVAVAEGLAHKALVPVGGRPMLARVAEALRGAGIARIAVSADEPGVVAFARAIGCEVIAPGPGPSASVAAGFAELGAPMLVTTADHALLESRWVEDFIADTPSEADVSILLAHRDEVEAALPGSRRTYLRLADGGWSGCNLFLLKTARAEAAIATWSAVEADRKRPWRIAARLGFGTLARYALGRLTLAGAVGGLGARIGIFAAAVPAREGLAAVDVDKLSDLAEVRALVLSRTTYSASGSGSS
jgi:CTP:molybdopterin cytidylyltransferase MocA